MELLNKYINGNYIVKLYNDGTKVRFSNDDEFNAEFPENIDIKITNWCSMGCLFCHENSTIDGKAADLSNNSFIDTLVAGTELAIGGGMVTSHPDLILFLRLLKSKGIITNITIHQHEFETKKDLIDRLVQEELIYGLGVSFHNKNDNFITNIKRYPNAVLHLINGIHTEEDFKYLKNNELKILILGYKQTRRGSEYFEKESDNIKNNQTWLFDNLEYLLPKFKIVSFDNLSLKQLNVKRLLSDKDWNEFYMGDDGQHTMYIDLVEQQFANNSTSSIRYELLNDIRDMFKVIKGEK